MFVASELELVADTLRRLTRLSVAERRVLAFKLVTLGWSKHRVAVQLGVSDSAVRAGSGPGPRSPYDSAGGDSLARSGCPSTPLRQYALASELSPLPAGRTPE